MGSKEDADEDHPSSYSVLQHISEEACRVAGEALHSVRGAQSPGHRRSQSEVIHKRGIQKLKSSMRRALNWGGGSKEEDACQSSFNPEVLANQKRQWYKLHSKSMDNTKYLEPTSLFEHFIITGIHPDANLEAVEDEYARKKKWERDMANYEAVSKQSNDKHIQGSSVTTLDPQILFKYPPGKKLALRLKDLAAFCFPGGIKAQLAEKTPSLSDLNELVYGQEHLNKDDSSFIFSLKVADNATLYGVCLLVKEIVQRQPAILSSGSPISRVARGCSRFLVSAPRCYCVLTRVPFFELHYEMLNRVTEPISPESVTTSEASEFRETDKDGHKNMQFMDDSASENAPPSPEIGFASPCYRNRTLERLGSSESLFSFRSAARSMMSEDEDDDLFFANHEKEFGDDFMMEWARENKNDLLKIVCAYHALSVPQRGQEIVFQPLEHLQAIVYKRPPVSALGFYQRNLNPCEPAEVSAKLAGAEEARALTIWTAATVCRVLSLESVLTLISGVLLEKQVVVVCPNLGLLSAVVLFVIPMIQPFQWQSLLLPVLPSTMSDFLDAPVPFIVGVEDKPPDLKNNSTNLVLVDVYNNEVSRGIFQAEISPAFLVKIHFLKYHVKTCQLPTLPRHKELISELVPIHDTLTLEDSSAQKHPLYKCSGMQAEAAGQFLLVMTRYMESLCENLKSHTITSVQSNSDRVSLLLKDSFIDSFPTRDQPFIKTLVCQAWSMTTCNIILLTLIRYCKQQDRLDMNL
ncbi:hypothetical protein ACFE04_000306 [Oxalis oulophora]